MIEKWQPGLMHVQHPANVERRHPRQADFEKALNEPAWSAESTEVPAEVPKSLEATEQDSSAAASESVTDRAGAVVEATLVPWQLTSQGVLSQISQGLLEGATAMRMHGAAAASAERISAGAVAVHLPLLDAAFLAAQLPPSMMPGVQVTESRHSMRDATGVDASGSRLAGLASPWPERLVRWIAGTGDDVTAWIRDYRLADSDIPSLVEQLILHSESNGIPLARVVINGQERWHANYSHPKEFR